MKIIYIPNEGSEYIDEVDGIQFCARRVDGMIMVAYNKHKTSKREVKAWILRKLIKEEIPNL